MIDPALLNSYPASNTASTGREKAHLLMRRDPEARMAGSIPVWQRPQHGAGLSQAPNTPPNPNNPAPAQDFQATLHYADQQATTSAPPAQTDTADDEFTFGDLVDIVNPLHHIPLVSTVYESVTGDTIKPAGRIIGGAVFGGFVGAAAGMANVIVEEETGKDVAGNIVAMVRDGELPSSKPSRLSPEEQLDSAARLAFNGDDNAAAAAELPAYAHGLQQFTAAPPRAATEHTPRTQAYNNPQLPRPALINPLINQGGITESDIIPASFEANPFHE